MGSSHLHIEPFKLLERLTADPYCISSEALGPNALGQTLVP